MSKPRSRANISVVGGGTQLRISFASNLVGVPAEEAAVACALDEALELPAATVVLLLFLTTGFTVPETSGHVRTARQ